MCYWWIWLYVKGESRKWGDQENDGGEKEEERKRGSCVLTVRGLEAVLSSLPGGEEY